MTAFGYRQKDKKSYYAIRLTIIITYKCIIMSVCCIITRIKYTIGFSNLALRVSRITLTVDH